jgi:tetratricopeptide (TPR) repeat protein
LIGLYQARGLAELLSRLPASRLSEVEWIRVNAALGQVYAFLGDRTKAASFYATTSEQLDAMGDSEEVCKLRVLVYQGLGQLQYNEAPGEALVWLERAFESLAACQATANPETEAALYIDIAWAYRRLHRVAEAVDALQKGLAQLPRRPSQLRGEALTRLAALYVAQFDLIHAEQYAQVAVENSRNLRDVWHEQSVLVTLGTIKHLRHDWQGAGEEYEAALRLASAIGDRAAQAALEVNLGVTHANLGNLEAARQHLTTGLALSQQSNLRNHELKGQLALGRVHMRGGRWLDASSHLDAAETLVEQLGTTDAQYHLPLILSARAEVQFGQSRLEQALTLAESSVTLAIEQEKQVDRAACQRVLAQVLAARGDLEQARVLLEESLLLLEGRYEYEAARIKALLGHCLVKMGDSARGVALLEEARHTFEKCGATLDLAEVAQQQS